MQMLLRNMMIEITIKYNLALYAYDAVPIQPKYSLCGNQESRGAQFRKTEVRGIRYPHL